MLHDSQDSFYRLPLGAQPCKTQVRLRFLADASALGVTLRVWQNWESLFPMRSLGTYRDGMLFEAVCTLPEEPCQFWYSFIVETTEGRTFYGNARDQLGGVGQVWPNNPPSFQITVYDPAFRTPDFLHKGVCYQIFPDRYAAGDERKELLAKRDGITEHADWNDKPCLHIDPLSGDNRADDYFGGNLWALRDRLNDLHDYGIDVLYLNPIFQAFSNHRYNTADYHHVDDLLGGNEALDALLREADRLGMHVLLDGVFSHTGDDSVYFNRYGRYTNKGAWQGAESPYYSWFTFREYPDDYVSWWGVPTLPQCNKADAAYQQFFLNEKDGVLPTYVRKGTSGWRLDVADEIADDVLEKMRTSVKAVNPQACLIGEVWEDATNKISYGVLRTYALGRALDGVMNYPLRTCMIDFLTGRQDAPATVRKLRSLKENYPPAFLYACMNLMGSHDRARILSVLGGEDGESLTREEMAVFSLTEENHALGRARLLLFWAFLCCFPGMPTLYYGDECGMEGLKDPFNRAPYPWGREDRDLQKAVGFWIALRKAQPLLTEGDWQVFAPHKDVLLLTRFAASKTEMPNAVSLETEPNVTALVLNRAQTELQIALDGEKLGCAGVVSLSLPALSAQFLLNGKQLI